MLKNEQLAIFRSTIAWMAIVFEWQNISVAFVLSGKISEISVPNVRVDFIPAAIAFESFHCMHVHGIKGLAMFKLFGAAQICVKRALRCISDFWPF